MNNRALTLSLVMSLMAVYFVWSYVSSIEDDTRRRFGTEVVVIKAKRDIKEMETVNETMLEVDAIPKRFLEPAAIYSEDPEQGEAEIGKSMKSLAGTVAIVPIKKGEQVTFNKLTEPSMRTGLAPQVTPGRRAISIPVTEVTGVSKLVKAGDRVDLIAILDTGAGKQNRVAKTILQDVVVLAAGRAVTNNLARVVEPDPFGGKERIRNLAEDASFSSVTLEVEPTQAQAIALIASNTENILQLSLRNNDDTERQSLGTVMLPDVLGTDMNRVQRVPSGGNR